MDKNTEKADRPEPEAVDWIMAEENNPNWDQLKPGKKRKLALEEMRHREFGMLCDAIMNYPLRTRI